MKVYIFVAIIPKSTRYRH